MLRRAISLLAGAAGLVLVAQAPRTWLDVPFVRQGQRGCGAASIAMVLQYWGHSGATAAAIQNKLYDRQAGGILASDVQRYLESHGFRTFTFRGAWPDLGDHLSKGRPLIVCLKEGTTRHYVVVAGIDPPENIVMLNDPALRKLSKLARGRFERAWAAGNNWTLLALPEQTQ